MARHVRKSKRVILPPVKYLRSAVLFLLLTIFLSPFYPKVVRIEIASCDDVLNSKAFGDVEAYELHHGQLDWDEATK